MVTVSRLRHPNLTLVGAVELLTFLGNPTERVETLEVGPTGSLHVSPKEFPVHRFFLFLPARSFLSVLFFGRWPASGLCTRAV